MCFMNGFTFFLGISECFDISNICENLSNFNTRNAMFKFVINLIVISLIFPHKEISLRMLIYF